MGLYTQRGTKAVQKQKPTPDFREGVIGNLLHIKVLTPSEVHTLCYVTWGTNISLGSIGDPALSPGHGCASLRLHKAFIIMQRDNVRRATPTSVEHR